MAKQKATRTTGSRPAGGRGPVRGKGRTPRPKSGWSPAVVAGVVAVALAAALGVFWVTRMGSDEPAGGDRIEHVHGLGVNPADGELYAAAHNGVFRVGEGGKAQRVGDGEQDTMGFTIVGADHFLASGHPAPGAGGPANLGLIESTDGGRTWKTLSLKGQADFHALRFRHDRVYGYHAGQLRVSSDKRTWDTRSQVALRDFAVSPSDPDTLVATSEQGLVRSTDGGRSWSQIGRPVILLDWPTDEELWGIGTDGAVMRSGDGGATWSSPGTVTGRPAAFAVHEKTLYLATVEGQILQSRDEGTSWDTRYA